MKSRFDNQPDLPRKEKEISPSLYKLLTLTITITRPSSITSARNEKVIALCQNVKKTVIYTFLVQSLQILMTIVTGIMPDLRSITCLTNTKVIAYRFKKMYYQVLSVLNSDHFHAINTRLKHSPSHNMI